MTKLETSYAFISVLRRRPYSLKTPKKVSTFFIFPQIIIYLLILI